MNTLDYHTTGTVDEHMTASEHDDGKPPLRKQQSMLLITVIIDGLIAIIALITDHMRCSYDHQHDSWRSNHDINDEGFPDTIHCHSNRELD